MLIKYSVENFKSIRDKVELSMEAVGISDLQDSIIIKEGEKYLPLAVLYGPNGGGKSNILESLFTFIHTIINPIKSSLINSSQENILKVRMTPFLFNNENVNKPISFEIIFSNNLGEYKYIISFLKNKVITENLDIVKYSTNRPSNLFERNYNVVKLGEEFKKLNIPKLISDELPLLSFLGITYSQNEIVADAIDWFFNGILVENYASRNADTQFFEFRNKEGKELFLQFLNEMNIDIKDYKIEKKDNAVNIYTFHDVNGYIAQIHYMEESSGTKKMFSLAPKILRSLDLGSTLVIDELDAKLHPLILKYIIQLYNNKESNKNGAQLIFTSHDMTTMTSELFRRDEIWFAAKGNHEDTQLYSLIEFKDDDGNTIRKDAVYNKQYLEGKYGADPYFKRIIDWDKVN